MYPPPWMKNSTGSGSSVGVAGATTLTVRQSSLIGWDLFTPRTGDRRRWGAQNAKSWQARARRHGIGGRGARSRSRPTGGRAYGTDRHLVTPSPVIPSTVPLVVVTRVLRSTIP